MGTAQGLGVYTPAPRQNGQRRMYWLPVGRLAVAALAMR